MDKVAALAQGGAPVRAGLVVLDTGVVKPKDTIVIDKGGVAVSGGGVALENDGRLDGGEVNLFGLGRVSPVGGKPHQQGQDHQEDSDLREVGTSTVVSAHVFVTLL
jgi:hypothetical protein